MGDLIVGIGLTLLLIGLWILFLHCNRKNSDYDPTKPQDKDFNL